MVTLNIRGAETRLALWGVLNMQRTKGDMRGNYPESRPRYQPCVRPCRQCCSIVLFNPDSDSADGMFSSQTLLTLAQNPRTLSMKHPKPYTLNPKPESPAPQTTAILHCIIPRRFLLPENFVHVETTLVLQPYAICLNPQKPYILRYDTSP